MKRYDRGRIGRALGYHLRPGTSTLSWIGEERVAVGRMPSGETLPALAGEGVTHVVNCRARLQTWSSQDLAASG